MISIPFLTTRVDLSPCGNDCTSTIIQTVSFITFLTYSNVLVEKLTLRRNLTTYSLGVKEIMLRALNAHSTIPLGAAKVVIKHSKNCSIVSNQRLDIRAGSNYCLSESRGAEKHREKKKLD